MDILLELALLVALPAFMHLVWKLDNRVQSLEYQLKILNAKVAVDRRRSQVAIVQITAYLEKTSGFIPRSHFGGDSDPWPDVDPPTSFPCDD